MSSKEEAARIALERVERRWQALEHPANKQAMEQLKALVTVPGALKIITNTPDPQGAGLDSRDPHYWLASDVTWIEGPDHNGNLSAHSREGDYCIGNAHALLGRLTEYSRYSSPFIVPDARVPELVVPEPLTKD